MRTNLKPNQLQLFSLAKPQLLMVLPQQTLKLNQTHRKPRITCPLMRRIQNIKRVMRKPKRKSKMRASKLKAGTMTRTLLFLDPRPAAVNLAAKKTMGKEAPWMMKSYKMLWKT